MIFGISLAFSYIARFFMVSGIGAVVALIYNVKRPLM